MFCFVLVGGKDGVKIERLLSGFAGVLWGAFHVSLLCARDVGEGEQVSAGFGYSG